MERTPLHSYGVSLSIWDPQKMFFIFGSQNAYFRAFSPAHLECLFLQCNTSRSRPALRLPTLTFQADCGSIKGAGVTAEEGTEHYVPWQ